MLNDTTAANAAAPEGQYSSRARVSKSEERVKEQEVSGSPPDDRIANLKALSQHAGDRGLN